MAATVGANLTFVAFPDRHAGLGPFKSSTGAYYFVGRSTALAGQITIPGTTDPMGGTWAPPGADKTMSSSTSNSIQAAAAYKVGDVIHIVTQISTGAVYYNNYNISTDAWGLTTSEVAVAAASQAPVTNYTFVTLRVRSNGNVVIGYQAGQTAMSSGFNMVRYRERTGTNTYGTATNVDNGGSVNWSNPIVELGASDRVHFFFRGSPGGLYQRTLSAANALETFPSPHSTIAATAIHPHSAGVSYVDGGTTKVAVPLYYQNPAGTYHDRIVRLNSADAPTVSGETASQADIQLDTGTSNQSIHALAVDGTTLHYLYVENATDDLFHDSDGGTGTWGTDVEEWDAATINRLTANVYDRSGTKLAIVVDDGGTLKYAEISLAGAPPSATSFIWPTETPYRILSRR